MNQIDILTQLEKKNTNNKLELAKLSEREKALKDDKEKIIASLKELGIDENTLSDKLAKMETELNVKIAEIQKELE